MNQNWKKKFPLLLLEKTAPTIDVHIFVYDGLQTKEKAIFLQLLTHSKLHRAKKTIRGTTFLKNNAALFMIFLSQCVRMGNNTVLIKSL